jgi:hypothetical protein
MRSLFDVKTQGAWGHRANGIDLIHFITDNSYPERFGLKVLGLVAAGREGEARIPEVCAAGFLADSIFCEYAYILNLDTAELEYYRGRNTDAAAPGRYAAKGRWSPPPPMSGVSFYGVRLVQTIPFAVIRTTPPEKHARLLLDGPRQAQSTASLLRSPAFMPEK